MTHLRQATLLSSRSPVRLWLARSSSLPRNTIGSLGKRASIPHRIIHTQPYRPMEQAGAIFGAGGIDQRTRRWKKPASGTKAMLLAVALAFPVTNSHWNADETQGEQSGV